MALEIFVSKHLDLLNIERDAEIEESRCLQSSISLATLQRKGIFISKLQLGSCHTGLFGRCICTFESNRPNKSLGAHNITSGDIVGIETCLSNGKRDTVATGIVSHVTPTAISVSFDDDFDSLGLDDDSQYGIHKLANEVTYKRMKRALLNLKNSQDSRTHQLVNVLFGNSVPSNPLTTEALPSSEEHFFNTELDTCQQEAVKFALTQREVAIVHGPPGTGKTTTVVEVIMQSIKQGLKILACAPSNIAVDNLVERLASQKVKVVRLGHPARVLSDIQKYSLDAILSRSEEHKIIGDLRNDIDTIRAKAKQLKNRGEREKLWSETKTLQKELKDREKTAVQQILKRADVVLATLTSASNDGPLKHVPEHFNMVIIDECSQAIEAACWIPLLLAPKCILAGDHHQLPPTIVSERAAKGGLAVSLMERLINLHKEKITRMLLIQYRMHENIMAWPSMQLYENKLMAHSSVAHHLLKDLQGVELTEETSVPLLLIDTTGCCLYELELEEEDSKGNEGEADLVAIHVEKLIENGVKPADIAVISPYNLQVDLLRLRLSSKYPSVEIKSVDGFQGREKEAVVLSLVRSNDKGEVGFLAENRRINVAITRARRHLAVVCDSETVSHHEFLKSLIKYMSENSDVQSAHQYENDLIKVNISRPEYLQFKKPSGTNIKSDGKKNETFYQKESKKREQKAEESQKHKKEIVPRDGRAYTPAVNERDKIVERLQDTIKSFVESDEKVSLPFPSILSVYERKVIHELAEKFGLVHVSQGEGAERHIIVSKKGQQSRDQDCRKEPCMHDQKVRNETALKAAYVVSETSAIIKDKQCTECLKNIPPSNFDLHFLHCKAADKKLPKKSKTKPQTKHTVPTLNEGEEDLDALLASFTKSDNTCHFSRCKTSTATLSQTCQFCKLRYCLSHHIPEVHGCGDLAKAHARSQIRKEGKLHSGSGVPSKKPDSIKRAHLQKKFDKKLVELSKQRTGKK